MEWYEDQDNLYMTARHMADSGQSADAIVRLIEKPWNYFREYNEATAAYIVDLDDNHLRPLNEIRALWEELQARCDHPDFEDDGEEVSCTVCQITVERVL